MTATNEIKKVSYKEYYEAKVEMGIELNKIAKKLYPEMEYCHYVEIYSDFYYDNTTIETKVNWSAIGSVSAEEAVKFAQLLTKAAELANNFKYNGYKVYYTDED